MFKIDQPFEGKSVKRFSYRSARRTEDLADLELAKPGSGRDLAGADHLAQSLENGLFRFCTLCHDFERRLPVWPRYPLVGEFSMPKPFAS